MLLKKDWTKYFKIDRELIIVFFLVAVAGIIFFFVSNQRAFLNFFYLPVLVGAYFFGKRYATQSALFSILLISVMAYYYPTTFSFDIHELHRWLDIATWGAFLLITGYFMGHLYEKKEKANKEIKKTYNGIIEIMSLVIDSAERAAQSHSYRVSVISGMIAREMGLSEAWVENIRIASLLHDLGKLDVSREVLNKFSKSTCDEYEHMRIHTSHGAHTLDPVCGRILDIMPSILYHQERYDGSGELQMAGNDIPLGSRIIAVADGYDSLICDPLKSVSPLEAKQQITQHSRTRFDPGVVKAFTSVYPRLNGEVPVLSSGERS